MLKKKKKSAKGTQPAGPESESERRWQIPEPTSRMNEGYVRKGNGRPNLGMREGLTRNGPEYHFGKFGQCPEVMRSQGRI